MPSEQPVCELVDTHTAPQRPYHPVPIWSVEDLERILRAYVDRHPRILEVHLPQKLIVWFGLGGDLAAVDAYPIPNPPPGVWPCWTAQARYRSAAGPREFVNQGVPYTFAATALMPPGDVIDIVLHIVRHRDLPDSHVWAAPGADRYRWGEAGTRAEWEAWRRVYERPDDIPF